MDQTINITISEQTAHLIEQIADKITSVTLSKMQ